MNEKYPLAYLRKTSAINDSNVENNIQSSSNIFDDPDNDEGLTTNRNITFEKYENDNLLIKKKRSFQILVFGLLFCQNIAVNFEYNMPNIMGSKNCVTELESNNYQIKTLNCFTSQKLVHLSTALMFLFTSLFFDTFTARS
jgi:hypothetical protein